MNCRFHQDKPRPDICEECIHCFTQMKGPARPNKIRLTDTLSGAVERVVTVDDQTGREKVHFAMLRPITAERDPWG